MSTDAVQWITCQHAVLVRIIAITVIEATGYEWDSVGLSTQTRTIGEVAGFVEEWVQRSIATPYDVDGTEHITSRRRALVRAICVVLTASRGGEGAWERMKEADRTKWLRAIEKRVSGWVRIGLMDEFSHPYAGEPIPDTEPAEDGPQEAPKARRARR